jgi:hypothetical protein
MVKLPAVLVDPQEIADLFSALELWDKIRDGRLDSAQIPETIRQASGTRGGYKCLMKHRNRAGFHVCTTHQIIDGAGQRVHWDESDVKLGDITIAKRPRPRNPT